MGDIIDFTKHNKPTITTHTPKLPARAPDVPPCPHTRGQCPACAEWAWRLYDGGPYGPIDEQREALHRVPACFADHATRDQFADFVLLARVVSGDPGVGDAYE